jgi:hypothetical protein
MKKIVIYAASFILSCMILGCSKTKKAESQAGVYKLDKQMASGGGKDTTYRRTQIKIYTDRYFIYAGMAPDSSVGFGVGNYKLDTGNKVTESNIYSSGNLDSAKTFNLLLTRTDSGYTQIIPDLAEVKGVKYKLTENYSRLPSTDTSVLDGVWKLDKTFTVKGKDTVKEDETQYKAFWGGHFMFIHRYPLDAKETMFKNGFGYGDFSLKNDTLNEEDQLSSHAVLLHRKFAIRITFNGKDEYSQVISDAKNNQQSIEIYRRLK